MLDAVLQEQILCLPPRTVYEPPHHPPCSCATPRSGVCFPLPRLGSEKQGIWQLGAQGSLYKALKFLLIPVNLPSSSFVLLPLFPLTL